MNLNWTSGTAIHMLKMLELGGYQYRVNGMDYKDNSNLQELSEDEVEAVNAGYRIAENEVIAVNAKHFKTVDMYLLNKALRHGLNTIERWNDEAKAEGEDPISILDISVSDHGYDYYGRGQLNEGDVLFVHDAGFLSADYRAGNVYTDLGKKS